MNTPNIASQQFDEICEWYRSIQPESEQAYHLYAIVDGVLDQNLLFDAQQKNVPWRVLYPDSMLESNNPATAPFLLALTPDKVEQASLMQTLLQRGRDVDLVLWVASRQPLPVLAAHLHSYAEVVLPDRTAALLRHYDPSILEVLVRMFTLEQREHFLSPIFEYRYWREGWQTVAGTDNEKVRPPLEQYITLDGEQYALLSNESFAEMLYHQIREELLPPMSQVDGRVCIQLIRQLLARAVDRYQIKNQNDLAYFSLVGLNVNPKFDEHPKVAEALLSEGEINEPTSSRLAQIDAAVWSQLLQARADSTPL